MTPGRSPHPPPTVKWCADLELQIERFHIDEAGFTVRARRSGSVSRVLLVVLAVAYAASTMVLATRLRTASGSGSFSPPPTFTVTKAAGNPLITVNPGNPSENVEQYAPSPILVGSTYWVYVKGAADIDAWSAPDPDGPFTLQANGVIAPQPGTWEHAFALEPHAIYDEASDTIHVLYAARDTNPNNWAWGHATAPGSTPTVFTKDVANPILTANAAEADLGSTNITDLKVSSVVKIGSSFHFYGYALWDGIYHLIKATGTTWNDPDNVTLLRDAPGGADAVIQTPSVFKYGSLYGMLYSVGEAQPGPRSIWLAWSLDGSTFDFDNAVELVTPASGWESNEAYSGQVLRETAAPYSAPILDAGRLLLFYSGLNATPVAQSGLAYLVP